MSSINDRSMVMVASLFPYKLTMYIKSTYIGAEVVDHIYQVHDVTLDFDPNDEDDKKPPG